MGAMDGAQTLAQLHMHAPTKPTAAKARPAPAMGAPVAHLDVLQALSLQSWQQWPKPTDRTATGRGLRYQPCFLSHTVPGDQLWFQPRLCVWAIRWHLRAPRARRGSAEPAELTEKDAALAGTAP